MFKSQDEKNAAAQHSLEDKIRENNELESYRPKLKQIEQQLAELKQQLEIEQRIVPDEKKVDGFITMLDGRGAEGGHRTTPLQPPRTSSSSSTTPKFLSRWNSTVRITRCWVSLIGLASSSGS